MAGLVMYAQVSLLSIVEASGQIPFLPLIHGVHHELAARAAVFDVKDYDWPLMAELVTSDRVADIAKCVTAGRVCSALLGSASSLISMPVPLCRGE